MCFTGKGGGKRRQPLVAICGKVLLCPAKPIKIIDHAGRDISQQPRRGYMRIAGIEETVDLCLCQIGNHAGQ